MCCPPTGSNLERDCVRERTRERVGRIHLVARQVPILGSTFLPARAAACDVDVRTFVGHRLQAQLLDLVRMGVKWAPVDDLLSQLTETDGKVLRDAHGHALRLGPDDDDTVSVSGATFPDEEPDARPARFARFECDRERRVGRCKVRLRVVEEAFGAHFGQNAEKAFQPDTRRAKSAGVAHAKRRPDAIEPQAFLGSSKIQASNLAQAVANEGPISVRIRAPQELHAQRPPRDERAFAFDPHVRRSIGPRGLAAQHEPVLDCSHRDPASDSRWVHARRIGRRNVAQPRRHLQLPRKDVHHGRVGVFVPRRRHHPCCAGFWRALEHENLGPVRQLDPTNLVHPEAGEHVVLAGSAVTVGNGRTVHEERVGGGPGGKGDEHDRHRRAARFQRDGSLGPLLRGPGT